LTIPDHLAERVFRCPRCKADLSAAASASEAITDRPTAPPRLGGISQQRTSDEAKPIGAAARVQLKCEGCGDTLVFSPEEMGTVQECPSCGDYIDIPDLTIERYERQMRLIDGLLDKQSHILDRWEALAQRLECALTWWEQHRA
jgi:hypothetical protein